ncbi:hypothetical protein D6C89_07605 [Aureobasidium pullulans]|nr:hypothetical protein D6C89_07605 [Aureobasidium pullulans]
MCFETVDSTTSCIDTIIEDIISEPEFKSSTIDYFPTLVRKSNAIATIQDLACNLIKASHPVDIDAINFPFGRPSTTRVLFDLLSYPWNHTVKHWGEPRLNKALRDRVHEVHNLLSAFLARDENKQILRYELRDVYMLQALLVPDDLKGVKVQLTLRPSPNKALYSHGWKEFTLCSVNHESEWLKHCKGRILTVLKPAGSVAASNDVSFIENGNANFGDDEDY